MSKQKGMVPGNPREEERLFQEQLFSYGQRLYKLSYLERLPASSPMQFTGLSLRVGDAVTTQSLCVCKFTIDGEAMVSFESQIQAVDALTEGIRKVVDGTANARPDQYA